jgi:hypothetical protein
MNREEIIKLLEKLKEKNEELYRHICGLIKAALK